MFVLHWVGLEGSGFWYCFDGVLMHFCHFHRFQTLELHVGNWTHGFMVKLAGVDFHWLYGLTDGKTTATSCAIRMVGNSAWWETHGDVSVVCKGFVLVGYVDGGMGFGGFCPWKSRGGNRVGGETLPLGSGASVLRRVRWAAAGWWAGGWGASPLSTQIVMKQRKIRHEAFLL